MEKPVSCALPKIPRTTVGDIGHFFLKHLQLHSAGLILVNHEAHQSGIGFLNKLCKPPQGNSAVRRLPLAMRNESHFTSLLPPEAITLESLI
jgi:hypothetical protein